MAIDFMTALRSRARSQERSARLSGRPQTQLEAAAPYVALADTASERMARSKALSLQEQQQATQKSQFGETLEFNRQTQEENARLERERMAESSRQAAAQLAFQKEQMGQQVTAAEKALIRDYAQTGLGLASNAYTAYKLFGSTTTPGTTTPTTTAPAVGAPGTVGATEGAAGMGAYGAQAGSQFAGWGTGAAAAGTGAATGAAIGSDVVGGGIGGGIAAEGFAGAGGAAGLGPLTATGEAGAAAGGAGAMGASAYTGPAAVVALPVIAYAFNAMAKSKRDKALANDPNYQAALSQSRAYVGQQAQQFTSLSPEQMESAIRTGTINGSPLWDSIAAIGAAESAGIISTQESQRLSALYWQNRLARNPAEYA